VGDTLPSHSARAEHFRLEDGYGLNGNLFC
jgi:hypothetical protein